VAEWIVQNQHTWQLRGDLNVSNVTALLKSFTAQANKPQYIDLQQVERTDSAGLALLLELKRLTQVQLQNLPEQMLQLASINEITDLLSN
jgi:phospholipid transport system transporter-binding protein